MTDCTNVEIRDQLPDLLHDRLTVSVRELVVAHVADCADCREELELLRGVHGVLLSQTARVDVAQIVAALPKPGVARVTSITSAPSRRMMRMDWRIAAAVTFLAVGGSSVALLERTPSANRAFPDSNIVATIPVAVPATTAATPATPATVTDSATPAVSATIDSTGAPIAAAVAPVATVASNSAASSTDDAEAVADVSPGGRFAGLTAAQLKALLGDIGQLPAVPVTEPDPVTIQVNTNSPDGP